jgi:hypothetical protein
MLNVNQKFFGFWRKCDANKLTKTLALFCAKRSGQWSEQLVNLVESDDFAALIAFDISYTTGLNVRELQYARQCLAFYSKDSDIKLVDTERAGWLTFIKSEFQNRVTNKKWSFQYQNGILYSHDDCILLAIARKISEIIGDPPLLEEMRFGFGPGSNANVTKKTGSRHKLQAAPACSDDMVPLLSKLEQEMPHYFNSHIRRLGRVVELFVGKLSFVGKNALTDRSILIEPVLNTFVQKGIGQVLKQRLLAFGCNLYTQVKNQRLALQGSIDGTIATVDLRNASNRIALLVVYHLFSFSNEWLALLMLSRTGQYKYKGEVRTLEMFSSMGNGFTFELESLIFYATALVVAERLKLDTSKVSVFGDDICIPVEGVPLLYKTLKSMGFEINESKSFSSGPFRESCGLDYYEGQNIRPFYKKDRWTAARIVGLLNFDHNNHGLFTNIRNSIICQVPRELRSFGPEGQGDGHIQVPEWQLKYVLLKTKQRKRVTAYFEPEFVPKGKLVKDLWDKYPSILPNRYYHSFIKVPNKDTDRYDVGDDLAPLYDIYAKPSLRHLSKEAQWQIAYDVYGIPFYFRETNEPHKFTWAWTKPDKEIIEQSIFSEHDPYVISGGWISKEAKIYMHN